MERTLQPRRSARRLARRRLFALGDGAAAGAFVLVFDRRHVDPRRDVPERTDALVPGSEQAPSRPPSPCTEGAARPARAAPRRRARARRRPGRRSAAAAARPRGSYTIRVAAAHPGAEVPADRRRARRPCRSSCTRSRGRRSPRRPRPRPSCARRTARPRGRRRRARPRSRRRARCCRRARRRPRRRRAGGSRSGRRPCPCRRSRSPRRRGRARRRPTRNAPKLWPAEPVKRTLMRPGGALGPEAPRDLPAEPRADGAVPGRDGVRRLDQRGAFERRARLVGRPLPELAAARDRHRLACVAAAGRVQEGRQVERVRAPVAGAPPPQQVGPPDRLVDASAARARRAARAHALRRRTGGTPRPAPGWPRTSRAARAAASRSRPGRCRGGTSAPSGSPRRAAAPCRS